MTLDIKYQEIADGHLEIRHQDDIVEKALVKHKKGKLKQAHDLYHHVLRINSQHPQALHYLGLMAQQSGHSTQAIELIEQSITVFPTDIRAYNHLAQIHLSQGRIETAKIVLERGLIIDNKHVDTLNTLANILADNNELEQAISLYRLVMRLEPNTAHSAFNLAQALKEAKQYKEALKWYVKTVEIEPKHLSAFHGAGITSEELGDFFQAIKYYQQSLVNNPEHVRSLANLISIKSFTPSTGLINKANHMLTIKALSLDDKAKLHNGLGKYWDANAKYTLAFSHFKDCCETQKRIVGNYDSAFSQSFCDQMIKSYNADFFSRLALIKRSDETPIFIVGMPRSGTTLTEQILASHSSIYGCGELTSIPKISKSLLGPKHNKIDELTEQTLENAADKYIQQMRGMSQGGELFFTDKLPMNFMYLGLIVAMFPNAKIIYCRREPMDIGLSCYIEMFNLVNDFSIDLTTFADYFLDQERIMTHWKKTLPTNIFEMKYEDLIVNQEGKTRELISFVGLEWQGDCLYYHNTSRAVNTPSRWQVRQPIYKTSSERWRNYQQQLEPLSKRLIDAGYQYI